MMASTCKKHSCFNCHSEFIHADTFSESVVTYKLYDLCSDILCVHACALLSSILVGSYIEPILHKVLQYLDIKVDIKKVALKEAWDILNEYLQNKFGGWKEILKKAFEVGLQAALSALEAVKDEIIRVCKENHRLLEQLTKLATKSFTSAASKLATQATANVLAKEMSQQAVKQSTKASLILTVTWSPKFSVGVAAKKTSKVAVGQIAKSVTKYATPLGIGADMAQAGLEWAGHKEVGKAVGITGNIASGALMGAPFGPPGAVLGALGGFAIWGAGEVIGGLVGRAFGNKEQQHDECRDEEDHDHDEIGDIEEQQHVYNEPRELEEEQQNEPGDSDN